MIKLKPLAFQLLLSLGVGGLAALLTRGSMEAYGNLRQPPLSPPGWVFPAVWSLLYLLMAVAAYLVWMKGGPGRDRPLALYGAQLGANFLWPLLFFNLQNYALAFFWLVLLWGLVLVTIWRFYRVSPAAGRLLVPYLVWVTFAGYLNAGVWLLNP